MVASGITKCRAGAGSLNAKRDKSGLQISEGCLPGNVAYPESAPPKASMLMSTGKHRPALADRLVFTEKSEI